MLPLLPPLVPSAAIRGLLRGPMGEKRRIGVGAPTIPPPNPGVPTRELAALLRREAGTIGSCCWRAAYGRTARTYAASGFSPPPRGDKVEVLRATTLLGATLSPSGGLETLAHARRGFRRAPSATPRRASASRADNAAGVARVARSGSDLVIAARRDP